MYVIKRDGNRESVKFDKVTARIQKLCYGLDPIHVTPINVAMKVIEGIYVNRVKTVAKFLDARCYFVKFY